ncbi:MAG TPA: aldo/keto reductase [Dissulfurispiraceae bacterium]|nr:aldo/keto reductase [Dissulfurispiraceae bacterium]
MTLPKRKLGATGVDVTILGLGGEGVLRTYGQDEQAYRLINRAIDLGITYFESAHAYDGSESYYGAALQERRKEIFLASKSHARNRSGALDQLNKTLDAMQTDYLDLWQIHDVREESEVKQIFGSGGAAETFYAAKKKGLVRYVGITGHHNPSIIRQCIEAFDFDTVLLPVNPAEPAALSFLEEVVPLAVQKNMGIIGMKVYFRGLAKQVPGVSSLQPFFRFALSQPVSTIVIGCDSVRQLEDNVAYAELFEPMTPEEQGELLAIVRPYARQLMYYKPL